MMLLSGMFCGDNHSFDYSPTNVQNINTIQISNGIFDDVFATKNTTNTYEEISKIWDYDTVLYALFESNLFGGNVEFTSDTVSAMRIKRRKKNTFTWDTMFEIPINNDADFKFERFDRFARSKTKYEYSIVPIINNIEGNLNTNSIETKFEGFYFIEKDVAYQAILNTQLNTERNHNGATISTLGRKYPFYISNGNANFTSGSLQATFINRDSNCNFDVDNAWKFSEQVDDLLTSGKPLILKNDEGKMWMVAIVGNIPHDSNGHYQNVIQTINWVEIGDADNATSLYENGFIDTDGLIR